MGELSIREKRRRLFSLMMMALPEIFFCGMFFAISISSALYCIHEFHGYFVVTVAVSTFIAVIIFFLAIIRIAMALVKAKNEGLF